MPSQLPPGVTSSASALALVLALAACGGGNGGSPDGNDPPPANQPPVAASVCVSVPLADPVLSGTLPASDPDGDPLQYELIVPPRNGSLTTDSAGRYTYTPHQNARGMDRFTYRVRDPSGLASDDASVTLLVDGKVRIMPLGDSITVGDPGTSPAYGFRRRLHGELEALSPNYVVDFVGSMSDGASDHDRNHEGHGGACAGACGNGYVVIADNIRNGLGWLDRTPPDIILLHAGTNDLTQNPGITDAWGVESILNEIDAWEQANHPVTVFVARIIRDVPNHGDYELPVAEYNASLDRIVGGRSGDRVFLVDMEESAGLDYVLDADMVDDLHPNESGYNKMADRWKSDLLASGVLPGCP